MLQTGIFTFSIFSDGNDINIVVERLQARERFARSDVSKKLELLSQSDIKRSVTFADRGGEGA